MARESTLSSLGNSLVRFLVAQTVAPCHTGCINQLQGKYDKTLGVSLFCTSIDWNRGYPKGMSVAV